MSSPMLDPAWTPAAGYAHALSLLAACDRDRFPTIPHEGREHEVTKSSTTKTKPAAKPAAVSVKIPRRAYATAQRIAKRDRRTITTVIELAIEQLATTEGSTP